MMGAVADVSGGRSTPTPDELPVSIGCTKDPECERVGGLCPDIRECGNAYPAPPVGDTACHFCYQPATKSRREKTANGFRVRAFCVDCASIWDDYSARAPRSTAQSQPAEWSKR